jgi:hypothetical protein
MWKPPENEFDKKWEKVMSLPRIKEKKPCPICLERIRKEKKMECAKCQKVESTHSVYCESCLDKELVDLSLEDLEAASEFVKGILK